MKFNSTFVVALAMTAVALDLIITLGISTLGDWAWKNPSGTLERLILRLVTRRFERDWNWLQRDLHSRFMDFCQLNSSIQIEKNRLEQARWTGYGDDVLKGMEKNVKLMSDYQADKLPRMNAMRRDVQQVCDMLEKRAPLSECKKKVKELRHFWRR